MLELGSIYFYARLQIIFLVFLVLGISEKKGSKMDDGKLVKFIKKKSSWKVTEFRKVKGLFCAFYPWNCLQLFVLFQCMDSGHNLSAVHFAIQLVKYVSDEKHTTPVTEVGTKEFLRNSAYFLSHFYVVFIILTLSFPKMLNKVCE